MWVCAVAYKAQDSVPRAILYGHERINLPWCTLVCMLVMLAEAETTNVFNMAFLT